MDRALHGLACRMDGSPGFHHHARTYHRCEGWLRVEVVGQLLEAGIEGIRIEDHERSLMGGERYADITLPNTVIEIACGIDEVPAEPWFDALRERLGPFTKYACRYALVCVLGASPTSVDRDGFRIVQCIEGRSYTLLLYRREG